MWKTIADKPEFTAPCEDAMSVGGRLNHARVDFALVVRRCKLVNLVQRGCEEAVQIGKRSGVPEVVQGAVGMENLPEPIAS